MNKDAQAFKITRKKLRFRFSSISHIVRDKYPRRCQASVLPFGHGFLFFPLLGTQNTLRFSESGPEIFPIVLT